MTTKRRSAPARERPRVTAREADPGLFEPLSTGERADALRLVTEEPRLSAMAKVGRYRVIAVEPLALKPPHERAGHRLARVVIYDYAGDQRVDAAADLDAAHVFHVGTSRAQPMLSPEEEAASIDIAIADEAVSARLRMGDEVQAALHYWSGHTMDLSHSRRSAAVLFGPLGEPPSLVAVVNLVDGVVAEIVPANQW